MQGQDLTPVEIIPVLVDAGLAYILVGAHAANGYTGEPRATLDVDVIVRFPKKATAALLRAFPTLRAQDTPVVTRLLRPDGRCAVDVMKCNSSPLWGRLLKLGRPVRVGSVSINVPPVEGVLAAKFSAMVSPHRRIPKKMIDGADFINIVEANPKLDSALLEQLGELVYPGGGKEILKLVVDAKAGKRIEI